MSNKYSPVSVQLGQGELKEARRQWLERMAAERRWSMSAVVVWLIDEAMERETVSAGVAEFKQPA